MKMQISRHCGTGGAVRPVGWSRARAFAVLLLLAAASFNAHAQQEDSWEEDFKTAPPAGQRTFVSTCAGCHGLDGRGSERAPSVASGAKAIHLSDKQIGDIISNGVPGTGMPAFHSLTPSQVRALVGYIHILQGKTGTRSLPGDVARGKAIFFGKGECSSCHAASGEGGFIGPDLTTYGASRQSAEILKSLLNPNRIVPAGYKPAVVTMRDGTRLEGVVRNEDNFSVQLVTKEGTFHFFEKAHLQSLEYLTQSLMPADYATRLSRSELSDLISYLMNAGSSLQVAPHSTSRKKSAE